MPLAKKKYKLYDALILALKASPVCTVLKFLLSVTQSIMQTAVMAVATANFVDTAAEILNNVRPQNDIYLPLVLLLAALGVVNTIGAVAKLAGARVSVKLQRKLKPSLVKVYAAFEYKHIENAESWELISRVTRDPVKSIMDGGGCLYTVHSDHSICFLCFSFDCDTGVVGRIDHSSLFGAYVLGIDACRKKELSG